MGWDGMLASLAGASGSAPTPAAGSPQSRRAARLGASCCQAPGRPERDQLGQSVLARHSQAPAKAGLHQGKSPHSGEKTWRKKGCSVPLMGPLQLPRLPRALLHLESLKGKNEKVKQRQMQSTDKKYQGVNRLCFFFHAKDICILASPLEAQTSFVVPTTTCTVAARENYSSGRVIYAQGRACVTGHRLCATRQGLGPGSIPLKGRTPRRKGFPVGQSDVMLPKDIHSTVLITPHGSAEPV